jgi:hypothetical protein
MPRRNALLLTVITVLGLAGCAETPKQPEMRPIPPPPPTPPPGVAYVPAPATGTTGVPNGIMAQNPPGTSSTIGPGIEVSSNFVGGAQTPVTTGMQVVTPNAGVPQYEVVPPRPGPDYVWRNGYWRWEANTWAWMPGEWIYQPPSVIIVPRPGYYYGRPWHYGRRYHW